MPKVSIVLPTYNRAHLLERSVCSVLAQTYNDFELIIIDDNSSDNTKEVVEKFNDNRIRFIKLENNSGAAGARNVGLKNSSGQYIAFQDSDDEWDKNKLSIMINQFENMPNDYGLIFSQIKVLKNDNTFLFWPSIKTNTKSEDIYREVLIHNVIDMPATIIKKECLEKSGYFDTDFRCYEDYDFFIRVLKYYKAYFIPQPLLFSYESLGGVNTPNYSIRAEMNLRILEKYPQEYSQKNILSEKYFQIAVFYCLGKNFSKGKKYFNMAIDTDSYRIDYKIIYVFALLSGYTHKNLFGIVYNFYMQVRNKYRYITSMISEKYFINKRIDL